MDEGGDRMSALELYSKSLSAIRSGLASLHSSVGADGASSAALLEVRGKMERFVGFLGGGGVWLVRDPDYIGRRGLFVCGGGGCQIIRCSLYHCMHSESFDTGAIKNTK